MTESTSCPAAAPPPWRSLAGAALTFGLYGVLLVASSFIAYLCIYSVFADYDDEGYMMMTVRHMVNGHALYNEIPTVYGPFYYLYAWVVHAIFRLPLTNNATRLLSIGVWVATSSLISFCALKLTKRISVAALVYVLVFFYLRILVQEPGHPQELCGLLMALFVAVAVSAGGGQGRALPIVAGVSVVALSLTKVNVGALFTLSILLAATAAAGQGWLRAALRALVAAAAMLIPFVVARSQLGSPWALSYALLISLSVVPLLIVGHRSDWVPSWSASTWFVGSCAVMTAVTVGFASVGGSTLAGVIDGLIVMPQRLAQHFVSPAPISRWAVPLSVASIILALVHVQRERLGPFFRSGTYLFVFSLIKLAFGLWLFSKFVSCDRWAVLSLATPLLWLALTPFPNSSPGALPSASRLLLCFVAALQPFQAYPVPGSQSFFGTFLAVLIVAICVGDVLSWVDQTYASRPIAASLRRAGLPLALVFVAGLCLHRYRPIVANYRVLTPIGVPGAEWIRVDPARAATFRWLVASLVDNEDAFLCTTGFNSLHFWTGRYPLTPVVIGSNLDFYTPEQQRTVIASLASHPGSIIVDHASFFPETMQAQADNQIANYIAMNYSTYDSLGGFDLKVRRGQPRPALHPHAVRLDPSGLSASRSAELGH